MVNFTCCALGVEPHHIQMFATRRSVAHMVVARSGGRAFLVSRLSVHRELGGGHSLEVQISVRSGPGCGWVVDALLPLAVELNALEERVVGWGRSSYYTVDKNLAGYRRMVLFDERPLP